MLGVGGLQIMLDKGAIWIGSTQFTIIILTVVSVISLICFSHLGDRPQNPILDLRLFKSRNFTIGIVSITCAYLFTLGDRPYATQLLGSDEIYKCDMGRDLTATPIGIMPLLISPLIGLWQQNRHAVISDIGFLMYAVYAITGVL